jgi:hypothetical protein
MPESVELETEWLAQLASLERGRFLAHLAHKLTVVGRSLVYCDASAADRIERLRQVNEVQHRVVGYLQYLLGGREDTQWTRSVVAYVMMAADEAVRAQCRQAWDDCKRYSLSLHDAH